MANALKRREPDSNLILVDWENGASWEGVNKQAYVSAQETTDFLGDAVGQYIIDKGYESSNVTLIGHSVGAQTAGDAGEYYLKQKFWAKMIFVQKIKRRKVSCFIFI